MKKILLLLAAALVIAAAAGCQPKPSADGGDVPSEASQTEATDSEAVTVDGMSFDLSYETHHKDLYYKTDIVEMGSDTYGSRCDITSFKESEPLFVIHLVYYEGTTAEEVMAESDYELTEKAFGDLAYQYFEYDENGMAGHTYLCEYNGTAYTVSFASNADVAALEQAFMENIHFEA